MHSVIAGLLALFVLPAAVNAETRSLKLFYVHTGEKTEIAYKKDGKYIDSGISRVNQFLRDWRRNEPTKMDPRLLDLVWEVYQKSGSNDHIHVVSGYRSPTTNNMLRKRGRGVAKFSQHTLGKAIDFFLPDVKLSKLRELGLKVGAGGVGYYPTSGSPFVHLDTGNVRHWPRMSRQELARIFPDGKTLHLPADGKPLPGYEQAIASYEARKSGQSVVQLAKTPDAKKLNLFQRWAKGINQDQQDDEEPGAALAVRTADEPAETDPLDIKPAAGGAKSVRGLPGVQLAGGPVPGAGIGRTDGLAVRKDFEIAMAKVPVPAIAPRREPADQSSVLALAPELGRARENPADGAFTVAALSAEDIENMRANAIPVQRTGSVSEALARNLEPPLAVGAAASEDKAVKAVQVGFTAQDQLLKPDVENLTRIAAVGVPRKNPERRPAAAAARRTLELALAPAAETDNAATDAIRALIAANGGATGSIAKANANASGPARHARWALSANRTLQEISDIRAPAYGVGAIRNRPSAVLVAGFVKSASLSPQSGFAWGALPASFRRVASN